MDRQAIAQGHKVVKTFKRWHMSRNEIDCSQVTCWSMGILWFVACSENETFGLNYLYVPSRLYCGSFGEEMNALIIDMYST